MVKQLQAPIIYPITTGQTNSDAAECSQIKLLAQNAANAHIPFIQIREKKLSARALFELTRQVVQLVSESDLKVLVNDRFDVALTAGAHGVHLTSKSLNTRTVRRLCGAQFIIGVSAHSLSEVLSARDEGADFAVFGPIFQTESKMDFGPPQGVSELAKVVREAGSFPVLALGGVSLENVADCFSAGARGVAGIGMFSEFETLGDIASEIRRAYGQGTTSSVGARASRPPIR